MQSTQITSSTANILSNLQQKISKYLSPSYEASDIFDKSKAITKNHQQIIQKNKDFLKRNQNEQFIKTQTHNSGNQFDQLVHRRKKCQAKLYSMLLDHKVQESLRFDFSPNKIAPQKSSYRTNNQDLFSVSSLKQVKSQVLLPTSTQPNFLRMQKELEKIQKNIEKLTKKVNKKSSSKKLSSKKEMVQQSKVSYSSKDKKLFEKGKEKSNFSIGSHSRLPPKRKSPQVKNCHSLEVDKKLSISENSKNQRQNSEQNIAKHKISKSPTDQTSLFAKLTHQKGKKQEQKELQSSKLKKVGLCKFKQTSKKTIQMAKKNNLEQGSKQLFQISSPTQKKNKIKVNLIQCQSEQVL